MNDFEPDQVIRTFFGEAARMAGWSPFALVASIPYSGNSEFLEELLVNLKVL